MSNTSNMSNWNFSIDENSQQKKKQAEEEEEEEAKNYTQAHTFDCLVSHKAPQFYFTTLSQSTNINGKYILSFERTHLRPTVNYKNKKKKKQREKETENKKKLSYTCMPAHDVSRV